MEAMARRCKWSSRTAQVILASLLIVAGMFRAVSRSTFDQNESALAADQFSANAGGTVGCSNSPAFR